MKQTTTQYPTISIISLFTIVASLVTFHTAFSFTPQCPLQIMPSRATRSTQEAARCRQDNKAIAAAMAVDTNPTQVALPSVVSPPSAPNLTSLLTGHVGQEVEN